MNIREYEQKNVSFPNGIPVIDRRYSLPVDCEVIAEMYSVGLSIPKLRQPLSTFLHEVSEIENLPALGITLPYRSHLNFYAFTDLRHLSEEISPEKSVAQHMRNAYRNFFRSTYSLPARLGFGSSLLYINTLGQSIDEYMPEVINDIFGKNRTNPFLLDIPEIPLFSVAEIQK